MFFFFSIWFDLKRFKAIFFLFLACLTITCKMTHRRINSHKIGGLNVRNRGIEVGVMKTEKKLSNYLKLSLCSPNII